MKMMRMLTVGMAMMLLAGAGAMAQEKPKESEPAPWMAPAKAQIVLTEYDGTTKISSMPYTLKLAVIDRGQMISNRLRVGARIPIVVQSKEGGSSIQYQDVGTNLDCEAQRMEDGRYKVKLSLDRSSIYTTDSSGNATEWVPGKERPGAQPILRQFNGLYIFLARDGQTQEASSATDPLSGHTLKIEVTLTMEK
jgi:hypothetical protein